MPAMYRADQVGSLLRPPEVLEAHTAFREGKLPLERLRQVEDSARSRLGLPLTSFEERGYEAVEERASFPRAVIRALAGLSETERQVLVLRLVEDHSYREIADLLNCTPVAARLRFSRTLRRLTLALEVTHHDHSLS